MKFLISLGIVLTWLMLPTQGAIVSYWNMNESSGNLADSAGTNNTTAVNVAGTGLIYSQASVTAGSYGALTVSPALAAAFGTSIDFGTDGSNRGNFSLGAPASIGGLVTAGPASPDGLGTFTIMAWINLDSIVGSQRLMGTGPTGGWGFGTNDDDLRFTTFGTADNSLANSLVAGTWTHIAMTYNNNSWEGFINGVSAGVDTDAGNFLEETTANFRIGSNSSGTDQFLGRMDELKLFNTVLTPAEIQAAAVAMPVPEPTTWALLCGAGLLGLGQLRRRCS
jgi:hypothetical protein